MDKLGPYELNQIYCGECSELMAGLPADSIPFWLTSPPYDGLRQYNGYTFDFEAIARELWRITQPGGVGVWVVADETKDGSESGTSFRQALYFMGLGFNLHDTMIYEKSSINYPDSARYYQAFEYMFIFSKGEVRTFNPIKDRRNVYKMPWGKLTGRGKDGELKSKKSYHKGEDFGARFNIWRYHKGSGFASSDDVAHDHPAIFPEALARDHILSWSNPGDLVFDPMIGSGTTAKEAWKLGRRFLGFEISEEYCQIARRRVEAAMSQPFLPGLVETPPAPIQLKIEA